MLLLRSAELPDGPEWLRELKFDGYRAVAVKSEGRVHLRSRNDNDFSSRYPAVAKALVALPDETVIDGEIVALDDFGRPSFNALQNGSSKANIIYYVFDLMLLAGTDVGVKPWNLGARCWRWRSSRGWRNRSGIPRSCPEPLPTWSNLSRHRSWKVWSPNGGTAGMNRENAPAPGAKCA